MQEFVGRLHGVRPIRQGDVQPEPRKDGVRLDHVTGESLAGAVDPDDGVLRPPGFTVTVDDIQVSRVEAFATGILLDVLGISRRSFRAAAHSQQ